MKANIGVSKMSSLLEIFPPSYSLKQAADSHLYPPSEVRCQGHLPVSSHHKIWYMEYGNPRGVPVVAVHGGPGGGSSPREYRFYNPEKYRIIIFDQRGSGRSEPVADVTDNTTAHLIDDMERLRTHLAISQWVLCGGSWGSALSLAYGQAHPERCLAFILRGIFLGTKREFRKLWQDMGDFYPEEFKTYSEHVPSAEREDLAQAFYKRLINKDPEVYMPAALAFYRYDMMCATLTDKTLLSGELDLNRVLALSRLFAHFSVNNFFFEPDQLLKNIHRINHLPLHIVHGRYDIICRVSSAFRLHELWPGSKLTIVSDAGHASIEPGITSALVEAIKNINLQNS
jgi:proline iminopeptidase